MTDFEKVTNFENLYKAYRSAKSGKGYCRSSALFGVDAFSNLHSLKDRLENKEYKVSKYNQFYVYEPKKRLIEAGEFVDKVVQHSLCDNVLLPKLKEVFIRNNFAGQREKGTHFGLNTLRNDMEEFYDKNGMCGYILKADVTKFFYSIDHDILKKIVMKYFDDPDVIWLCTQIIDSTMSPGLPLGNQTSQVFGLLYLNELDHFITETLGVDYYGRYMDDFYIIHPNRDYLRICLNKINSEVEKLNLTLNGKTQIMPFKQGIKFLGFHTYVKDGKVISKVNNENKRNAIRRYKKMALLVKEGKLKEDKLTNSICSYKGHLTHGDCEGVINKLNDEIEKIIKK